MIFDENTSVRETFPEFLKDALGQSRHERIAQNQEGVDRCNAEIGANEDIANNGNEQPEIRERAREKVEEERQNVAALEEQNEKLREKFPFRESETEIFKKYWFTVTAIVFAAGVTIGAVIGALTKALKKLGKGIGNGLQTIGKKIGSLLPGLISSIVSFIFKAAGQAISFLAEQTWLLILAVSLSTLSVSHTLNDFGGNHNTSENHS